MANENIVSSELGIKYLSPADTIFEDIVKQTTYEGRLIGANLRCMLSIPTEVSPNSTHLYVHYLLDTGSPVLPLRMRHCVLYMANNIR